METTTITPAPVETNRDPTCLNCPFCIVVNQPPEEGKSESQKEYQCRAEPPQTLMLPPLPVKTLGGMALQPPKMLSAFPVTRPDHWCGRHPERSNGQAIARLIG